MKLRLTSPWAALTTVALVCACNNQPRLLAGPDASTPDAGPATTDAGDACEDGVRNNGESEIDCGGDCEPCDDGSACVRPSDCRSGVCSRGYCLVRSCSDGVRNGPESGVDCGGDCGLCPDGESCSSNEQCESAHCVASMCVPAMCDDGRLNGGETDSDCGGRECAPCVAGWHCAIDTDCMTLRCVEGLCAAPTCSDRIQNQDETSVDCGGAICAPCADGFACTFDLDCANIHCFAGGCVSCIDGAQNAGESDVDCGGSVCEGCRDGKMCGSDADCASGRCVSGVCISCSDEILNADETDIDCGGTICGGCADGLACTGDADCASGRCASGACISCGDGIRNADETDIDCGGTVCGGCGKGAMCSSNEDCLSAACSGGVCAGVADTCARPWVLSTGPNTVEWVADVNDYFTTSPACVSSAYSIEGPDVVMSYTATVDGFLHYSIAKPSSTRWVLEVSSAACGTLPSDAICQSEFSGEQLEGQFPIAAGTTYYFYLADTSSGSNPLSSPLQVTMDEIVPPCLPGTGGVVGTTVTRRLTNLPSFTEYFLVADADPAGWLYIGGTSNLYRVPKAGGSSEDIEVAAGLSSNDMGYTVVVAGNEVFSIDESSTSTSNRIVRLTTDGGATWIPGGEDYATFATAPNDDFRGTVAYGGILYAITQESTNDTEIWSVPTGATTVPVDAGLLGTIPFHSCTGLAADAQYLYTMCSTTDEIVRIDRSTMATTTVSGASFSATRNSVEGDDNDGDGIADVLYYNLATEDAYYACGLDATPFTGPLATWGGSTTNYGLALDPAANTLYGYDDDTHELIVVQ